MKNRKLGIAAKPPKWILPAAFFILLSMGLTHNTEKAVPVKGAPPLAVPERGYISSEPAHQWEEAMISGNGKMGAMVMGLPIQETIILSHEKLFLPWEKPIPPVDTGSHLKEIRQMLAERKYQQAADYVVELSKKEGYGAKRWTDPFIPAFDLNVDMEEAGDVKNYGRSLDFATGIASVAWENAAGHFSRRLFVSRPDDVVVLSVKGPSPGKLNGRFRLATRPTTALPGIDADYWKPEEKFKEGISNVDISAANKWLTYRSRFKRGWPGGLQGYEGAAGVYTKGGKLSAEGGALAVQNADEILVLIKISPLLDLSKSEIPTMEKTLEGLASKGFEGLLAPHAKVHSEIFLRVKLDLGGGADHRLPSEQLVAKSRIGNTNRVLLEKEFDYSRYAILSSSGDWPPALQGHWTGTWGAPWSGDYTQDGNVQAAIASELSGNMPECLQSYIKYMDSMLPEFRENARQLYGARGIHVPSRMSSHGLNNHLDRTWPMTFWTAGAAWSAHFYYDHWLFTGDRKFLAEQALPFMKEAAIFYEDFLFEGSDGKYVFSPSYSPENAPKNSRIQSVVNATMDISLAKELLTNLIAACRELNVEKEGVERWTKMLGKMPDYAINADGTVKEWASPDLEDDYQHRHNSHLVALFDGVPEDIASQPKILAAFKKALDMRMQHRRSQTYREMAFGLVQLGQAATSLRDSKTAYEIVDWLANDYWTPALTPTHEPKKRVVFNVDICGGLLVVVIKMLLYSQPGTINLLPALPSEWPKGNAKGLPCRGQVLVKSLTWDGKIINAVLRSTKKQDIALRVPGKIKTMKIQSGSATISAIVKEPDGRSISLPANQDIAVDIVLD
jgi:hypothetical protein